MPRSRAPLVLLLLVTAVAVAAGCGSSSSSGGSSTGSTPPATSTPTTTTPPAGTGSGGSGGSGFCAQGKADVKQLQAELAALSSISSTPARLKAEMKTILNAYKAAEGQAPSEIKPDIAAVYATMSKMDQIFAAHNYDLMTSAPQAAPLFQSHALKAHFAHLKAWAAANC